MTFTLAPRFDRTPWSRIVVAGGSWGFVLAAGLLAMNARQCGLPCFADITMTTAISIGGGLLTIGPLAAFVGRR